MQKAQTKTKPFDPAEYLDTPEGIAAYMTEARKSGNSAFVADALDVEARARAKGEVARTTGGLRKRHVSEPR